MANYNITAVKTPNQLDLISQNNLKDSAIIVNYGNSLKQISYDVFKSTFGNISGNGSTVNLANYYKKTETSSYSQLNTKFNQNTQQIHSVIDTISTQLNNELDNMITSFDDFKANKTANITELGLIKAIPQNILTSDENIYYLQINNSDSTTKNYGYIKINDVGKINTEVTNIKNNINTLYSLVEANNNNNNNIDISSINLLSSLKSNIDEIIEYTYGEEYIRNTIYEISNSITLINKLSIGLSNIDDYNDLSVYIQCISAYDDIDENTISKWKLLSANQNSSIPIVINNLSSVDLSSIGIINNGLIVKNDQLLAYNFTDNSTTDENFSYILRNVYLQKNLNNGYIYDLSTELTNLCIELSNVLSTYIDNSVSELCTSLSTEIDDLCVELSNVLSTYTDTSVKALSDALSNEVNLLSTTLSTEIDQLSNVYIKNDSILNITSVLSSYVLIPETLSIAIRVDNSNELSIIEKTLLTLKLTNQVV